MEDKRDAKSSNKKEIPGKCKIQECTQDLPGHPDVDRGWAWVVFGSSFFIFSIIGGEY